MNLHRARLMKIPGAFGFTDGFTEGCELSAPFNSDSYYSRHGGGVGFDRYLNDGFGTAADGEIGGQDGGYHFFTCAVAWPCEDHHSDLWKFCKV